MIGFLWSLATSPIGYLFTWALQSYASLDGFMEKHKLLALIITGVPKLLSFLFPLGNSKAVLPMEEGNNGTGGNFKGTSKSGTPTSTNTSTQVRRELKRRSFEDTQKRVGRLLNILKWTLIAFACFHATAGAWNIGWGLYKSSVESDQYLTSNRTQFKTCTANGWYSPKADITPKQRLLCDESREYVNEPTYSIFWNTRDYVVEKHRNFGWFSIEALLAKLTYVTIKSLVSIGFLAGIAVICYLILSFINEYILHRNEASITPVEPSYGTLEQVTNSNALDKPREIVTNPRPTTKLPSSAVTSSSSKQQQPSKLNKDD